MEDQLSLTVTIKPNDGNVAVIITYPEEQQKLSLLEMSQILTGGISLIVKLANNNKEDVKDYEIMERVINAHKFALVDEEQSRIVDSFTT